MSWCSGGSRHSEVCAISGHAEGSSHQVLKHYLELGGDMADAAIARLVDDEAAASAE